MSLCRCMRLLFTVNKPCLLKNFQNIRVAGYKSRYSLEKLYPNSRQNFVGVTDVPENQEKNEDETFTGYINMKTLEFSFTRSSGPGGQHVNKVNTKAIAKLHVDSASWIPDWIKVKLQEQQKNKISKQGYLIVSSEKTRKQLLNKADCVAQIRSMVFRASFKPKEPTQEELDLIAKRKEKAQRERLRVKRLISEKKRLRRAE